VLFDLETDSVDANWPADVCIIGAGAAGLSLAVELLRGGQRVLLLESGALTEESRSQDLYTSDVIGQKHEGIHHGRFRVYGGTTTRWGGQILELLDHDFARRPWLRGSGWPFSKETLRGYYDRALKLEGLAAVTRHDGDVWSELGLETPDLGPELHPYFTRWCPEPNFAALHGAFLRGHANAHVVLHANACRMLFAGDGATIRGVVARSLNGKEAVFTAPRYVFCLGGIESCRFLLQPGETEPPPWQRNGLLGLHFQDHIDIGCADLVDPHPTLFPAYFDNVFSRGFKYQPRFRLRPEVQEGTQTLTAAGAICFIAPEDDTMGSMKRTARNLLKGSKSGLTAKEIAVMFCHLPTFFRQVLRYKLQRRAYNSLATPIRLGVSCEQDPLGESRIILSEKKDALGLYRARLDWRVSDLELFAIRTFVERVRAAFEKRGLCRVVIDPDFEDNAKLRLQANDANHHMGGARMSAHPAGGIVDLDLKIHGTSNAYVCSSAVFPTSGFSNPTHTLLALTVRLADHLQSLPAATRAADLAAV
jgi:choline dehydrogenase-like flavoprotein